jgi:hypothetical protein
MEKLHENVLSYMVVAQKSLKNGSAKRVYVIRSVQKYFLDTFDTEVSSDLIDGIIEFIISVSKKEIRINLKKLNRCINISWPK